MGATESSTNNVCTLSKKELDDFVKASNFEAIEVKALWAHFSCLSKTKGADEPLISREDFESAVGMKNSTFTDRLFATFDENDDGSINFAEFLTILSVLSNKATAAQKLEVSFKIYDMDNDGKIGREELATMLRATMDEHDLILDDAQIESVIDATFAEVSDLQSQGIDITQYSLLAEKHPMMLSHFNLNVGTLIAERLTEGIPLAGE